MESKEINNKSVTPTIYDVKVIAEMLAKTTNQKVYLDPVLKSDYIMGNISEKDLIEFGFAYMGMSNPAGDSCPIYRMGNIEAVYNGNKLYVHGL